MMTVCLIGAKSKQHPLESVPQELSRIKQLFHTAAPSDLNIEYEPYLTRPILGDTLRRLTDNIGILHFAGHSSADQLQTDDELIYAQHIATILQSWERKPCLVFLNGCNSSGQVDLFLEAGIACVIATHNYINDKTAALFAYEFYAHLLGHPARTTLQQAFTRTGATVLMGEARNPRSLDIEDLEDLDDIGAANNGWDWGIFSRDTHITAQWTLNTLQTHCAQADAIPAITPDFILKMKQESLQKRWQRLFERHAAVQEQADLETRAEEKIRMAHVLEQNRAALHEVEQEMADLK